MWEVKTGNTFGALAFSSYGGFWMSFACREINAFGFLNAYTNPVDLNNDLGIYLLSWAIFSLLMTIASHRTTFLLFFLFFFVFLTFIMLSIGKFTGGNLLCQKAGGVFGIIAATLAWYAIV